MLVLFAFNFAAHNVLWRAAGLLAVVVLFACLAILEFNGKPKGSGMRWLLVVMAVCVVILIAVLVALKSA